jgi:GNAT superfamily N-acetyltransferase/ketosteroid isomerase-like protein
VEALIHIRPLDATRDAMDAITSLLHRAYASLAAMGLNYTAVDQSEQTTAKRFAGGQGFVAEQDGTIVGTVVVRGALDADAHPDARVCAWYLRRDLAHLHQLGVEPALQGQGVGTALIAACEQWARDRGFNAIALDTAMPATHLRQRYAALGYAEVGDVQWSGKRYRTAIMVKPLSATAPSGDDAEHRCALVRALWAHVQARDWAGMRAAFHDDAVMHWPVTDERLEGAEVIVGVNTEYPEGWTLAVIAVDALADGRVHALVEVKQDGVTYFNNARFTFRGARIAEATEYWATAQAPPAWRTPERFGPALRRTNA